MHGLTRGLFSPAQETPYRVKRGRALPTIRRALSAARAKTLIATLAAIIMFNRRILVARRYVCRGAPATVILIFD